MNRLATTRRALSAAAASDPGQHREVNEDRFLCDLSRGLFIVIDGVGGQAAGGKAADIALTTIRTRLERETGAVVGRVKEAITAANNEILHCGGMRTEWHGMACVLTVVVVEDGRAIVGHVGDTRLYKLSGREIEKVTHDHSPIGEREDSHQISEIEAMQHPRRNEVYRDVGSELHDAEDPDFIEVHEILFEPDAALLLCSDGLTDQIASTEILETVTTLAGQPNRVVRALIEDANAVGGKDNITAVYVEGEQFASTVHHPLSGTRSVRRVGAAADENWNPRNDAMRDGAEPRRKRRWMVRTALVGLLMFTVGIALARYRPDKLIFERAGIAPLAPDVGGIVVGAGESIAAALERAEAGATVAVEPGEYHERVTLKSGVRLISRVPRAAILRLPGRASEADTAIVAAGVHDAEVAGFRIVGDAASPLGTGVLVRDAGLSIVDIEISGATKVAVDIDGSSPVSVVGSDIRDNPGSALAIRSGALPRIVHNVFVRNGLAAPASPTIVIEDDVEPYFSGNVFYGVGRGAFRAINEAARSALTRENWFPDSEEIEPSASRNARGRRGK